MKRMSWTLLILILVTLFFYIGNDPRPVPASKNLQQEPLEVPDSESMASPSPEPKQAEAKSIEPAVGDSTLISEFSSQLIKQSLQGTLPVVELESLLKKSGQALAKQVKGHPKSGQRLELQWSSNPELKAVYDILGEDRYQFHSLRLEYPANRSWDALKSELKGLAPTDIGHEDKQSIVWKSNEEDISLWAARSEDGGLRVTAEITECQHANGYHSQKK